MALDSSTRDLADTILFIPLRIFNLSPLKAIAFGEKTIPPTASCVAMVIKKRGIPINTPSSPVLTQFGYHIIWVDEVKEGGLPSLEKNWLDLEQMTLNQKKSDWYSNWIDEIKNNFYIKRNTLSYPQISN